MTETVLKRMEDDANRTIGGGSNWPWYGKLILWCFLTLIVVPASCTVATSFDDAAVTESESEYLKVKAVVNAKKAAAELALEKQRLETLERLIKEHNFGPVAARCAVEGWSSKNERETCEDAEAVHAAKR